MSPPPPEPTCCGGATPAPTADISNAAVLIAVVIFLCIVLLFVLLLYLYTHSYAGANPMLLAATAAGSAGRTRAAAARGLDAAALRALQTTPYRSADFAEPLQCAVCLSELDDGDVARMLPKCGHGFHVECIDLWLLSHTTCPLCRAAVVADGGTTDIIGAAQVVPLPPPAHQEAISIPVGPPAPPTEANFQETVSSPQLASPSSSESCSPAPIRKEELAIAIDAHRPARLRSLTLTRLMGRGRQQAVGGLVDSPSNCSPRAGAGDVEQGGAARSSPTASSTSVISI